MDSANGFDYFSSFSSIVQETETTNDIGKVEGLPLENQYSIQRDRLEMRHAITDLAGNLAGQAITYPLRDGTDVLLVDPNGAPILSLHAVGRESQVVRFFRAHPNQTDGRHAFSHIGELATGDPQEGKPASFESPSTSLDGIAVESTSSRLRFRMTKAGREMATFVIEKAAIVLRVMKGVPSRIEAVILGIAYAAGNLLCCL